MSHPATPEQESCWQQGATAAREGKPISTCPHKSATYDFVTWIHGWTFARHRMAVEKIENDRTTNP